MAVQLKAASCLLKFHSTVWNKYLISCFRFFFRGMKINFLEFFTRNFKYLNKCLSKFLLMKTFKDMKCLLLLFINLNFPPNFVIISKSYILIKILNFNWLYFCAIILEMCTSKNTAALVIISFKSWAVYFWIATLCSTLWAPLHLYNGVLPSQKVFLAIKLVCRGPFHQHL